MFCLRAPTDPGWAALASKDLDAVLVDHAHCEMKAATNALSLAVRHASDLGLVRALTEIAKEELAHFQRVVDFLERRGLSLGAPPVDDYAAELRRAMNGLPLTDLPLVVDRLLVGALIEARSCERFKLLLGALPPECPPDLCAFYEELFAAEARHYRDYVDLAIRAGSTHAPREVALSAGVDRGRSMRERVEARLDQLAEAEGRIVQRLAKRETRGMIHG
jgi:tRNA 2-(methylsulfanyl)-N6-isopentenyladenosine37 hydroxylase